MPLTALDWSVIDGSFVINLLIGLWYRKRATGSTGDFFVSGRRATWWLAGTSMVATTFAADTPLVVTGLVASCGIAGNWLWWSLLPSNMLTVGSCRVAWLAVTLLTAPEDKPLLLAFYRRTRPNPALWQPIAREAREVPVEHDGWNNLRDWLAGCAMIYLALFGHSATSSALACRPGEVSEGLTAGTSYHVTVPAYKGCRGVAMR